MRYAYEVSFNQLDTYAEEPVWTSSIATVLLRKPIEAPEDVAQVLLPELRIARKNHILLEVRSYQRLPDQDEQES